MSATVTTNGKPRKQLADQIDRLDTIIDCLADNLNQAVADAAKEGSRTAVKEILLEVLTDPTVLDLIRGSVVVSPPVAPSAPSQWRTTIAAAAQKAASAVKSGWMAVRARVAGVARAITDRVSAPVRAVSTTVTNAVEAVKVVAMATPAMRSAVLIGVTVAAGVAVAAAISPTLAGGLAGIVAGVTAFGVRVGLSARAAAARFVGL